MKAINKIEFRSPINLERSCTPVMERLGEGKHSMELFTSDGKLDKDGCGDIEWIIFLGTDREDVGANIGVWWENKRLTDYDGVFSLPKQAIKLLRKVGIVVPREFCV